MSNALTNTISVSAADISAVKAAYPNGKVFIFDNDAKYGGGVGGNGSIHFVADELPEEPPLVDNSIVIHKYLMENETSAGAPGTGLELDPGDLPAGASPIGGITFSVYQVDLTSHSGTSPDFTDFELDDPVSPTLLYSPKNSSNSYPLILIGTKMTNSEGVTTFTGLDDGLYLVVEHPSPELTVIEPCLVPLPLQIADGDPLSVVHIYPKNWGGQGGTPYSAEIVIYKLDANDLAHKIPLQGAKFKISLENTGANGSFLRVDGAGLILYPGDTGYGAANDWVVESANNGIARFEGIKFEDTSGFLTYYIFESEAPPNFNMLVEPVVVTFSGDDLIESSSLYLISVDIDNFSGVLYPETGGIGTTVFTLIGSAMIVLSLMLAIARPEKKKSIGER